MRPIFWLMAKQAQLPCMARRHLTRGSPIGKPSTKTYCLVQTSGQRCHWSTLFWERRWRGHHRQQSALQKDDNLFLLTAMERYGRRRHVVYEGRHYVPQSERNDVHSAWMIWGNGGSHIGDLNFPPRYCDFTRLDFFFRGFLKSQVCTNKQQSTDSLKVNITQSIVQIQPNLFGRVIEDCTTRIHAAMKSRGRHSMLYFIHNGIYGRFKQKKNFVITSHIPCLIPFQHRPTLNGRP